MVASKMVINTSKSFVKPSIIALLAGQNVKSEFMQSEDKESNVKQMRRTTISFK